ncbi:hypothetical protein [Streptomyces europaeiscabiei]|uniref:hypothetical protein n=1 Tax=Streptomyces europaeiscabiei TaxID=146819 RepID=UPI002E1376F3|nr:hypothetical protein OHB30_32980 [Streptomyces europaeiscabiei]
MGAFLLWVGMLVDDVLSAFWLWGPLALPLVVGGCYWALRPTGRRRRPRPRRQVLPSRRSRSVEAGPVIAPDAAPVTVAVPVSDTVADPESGTPEKGDADTITFTTVTYPPPPVDAPRACLFESAEEVSS